VGKYAAPSPGDLGAVPPAEKGGDRPDQWCSTFRSKPGPGRAHTGADAIEGRFRASATAERPVAQRRRPGPTPPAMCEGAHHAMVHGLGAKNATRRAPSVCDVGFERPPTTGQRLRKGMGGVELGVLLLRSRNVARGRKHGGNGRDPRSKRAGVDAGSERQPRRGGGGRGWTFVPWPATFTGRAPGIGTKNPP